MSAHQRAGGVVDDELRIPYDRPAPFPPATPFPGLVEFDAAELARLVLEHSPRRRPPPANR